jgi:hypothetical protein
MTRQPQVGPSLAARPVLCARPGCGVPYPEHPAEGVSWRCAGFLWVSPAEEPTGPLRAPPLPPSVVRPRRPPPWRPVRLSHP